MIEVKRDEEVASLVNYFLYLEAPFGFGIASFFSFFFIPVLSLAIEIN